MYQVGRQNTGVKKAVAEWAKAAALKHNQERMAGREVIIVVEMLLLLLVMVLVEVMVEVVVVVPVIMNSVLPLPMLVILPARVVELLLLLLVMVMVEVVVEILVIMNSLVNGCDTAYQGGGVSYWLARRLILARVHEALGVYHT